MKKGIFGSSRRGALVKAKKGDKVICYVTKECKIIATGELTSDYYMSDEKVFRTEGDFPDRFNFKAEKLASKNEIEIRSIIDELNFVTNKAYWSVFFRLSNRQISKQDYDIILTHLKK
jgi:predicted RNA-binding protein